MNTNHRSPLLAFWLGLLLLCGSTNLLRADEFGLFSYYVAQGTEVWITDYPDNAVGAVTIPAQIAGRPVTVIGQWAFSGCTGLTSVTIPASVRAIGWGAFSGSTGLTSVTIPASVTEIVMNAFERCTGLTSVTIPAGVTSIGDSSFSGCTGLTSVTIPASVTSIGEGSFNGCTGLTSVTIQAGVTSIGPQAFYGCTGLTSVTIPASVTSIGGLAFNRCTGLTSFAVAPGNTRFSSVDGSLYNESGAVLFICPGGRTGGYTIPASVTVIGGFAFADCTGLTSVTVSAEVYHIGHYAFSGCTALTSVTLPASVELIREGAFSGCRGLTSVTLPASVTTIERLAFFGCTGLTSFAVMPGNTHYSSVDGSLYNVSGTSLLVCPGGRTGGYSIPASVTSIGEGAFLGCAGLTSVTIPASVTSIGIGAFESCTGLTSVTLPASVSSIGGRAFYGCTGLTSVTIPASVTSIGIGAFDHCTGLKSAVFEGNAPTYIGFWAFRDAAPGFTVYYFTNNTGFTTPWWNDYPSIGIDPALWPAATWLLAHGLPYNTSLQQDPDGDGVSLLMGYALNLDPRQNLRSRQPAPVLGEESLSIRYYAAAPGITYRVETSRNLTQWTTTGITLSALDAENKRTASVPRDATGRFLRLVVQ